MRTVRKHVRTLLAAGVGAIALAAMAAAPAQAGQTPAAAG